MTRIAYLNGAFLPLNEARVSVLDRGFLMADAVYEVTAVLDGKLVDFDGHWQRLQRSFAELQMSLDMSREDMLEVHRRLIAENALTEGAVYLQVTRGAEERDFGWSADLTPTVVLFTIAKTLTPPSVGAKGINVISVPDLRWGRRDIKTVQLLYPSLAKMMASKAGADDAWMVEDGVVTEGTSNNAWIIKGQSLITRERSHAILHGITRAAVLQLAEEMQLKIEERAFTIEEAMAADEAFVTSATAFVMPVVSIDGQAIGEGQPGPIARRMRELYIEEARAAAL